MLEAGFFGLLRPVEMYDLTRGGIALPGSLLSSMGRYAVVAIRNPKNRRQLGRSQFATVRSENASDWLAYLCDGLASSDRLWPSTAREFRARFKHLCELACLSDMNFVPSSLRAGGATWMFMKQVEPPRLKFYGRWSSERTLNHYLQESVAQQLSHSASPLAQRLVQVVLEGGSDLLVPFTRPWHSFVRRPAVAKAIKQRIVTGATVPAPANLRPADRSWERLYPGPNG